jgi:predicted nucleic acid-binding Zn ribbon protein
MSKYRKDNRLVVEIVRRERKRHIKFAVIYIGIIVASFIVGLIIFGGR